MINFNQWVYGAYCGVMIQMIFNGNYTSLFMPIGFIFMFIGFELIMEQKRKNALCVEDEHGN